MSWLPSNKRHLLLLRWTVLTAACAAVVTTAVALSSRHEAQVVLPAGAKLEGLTSVLTRDAGETPVRIRFDDVTGAAGLDTRHFPAVRASLLPEDMGSGVACGDFDGDGLTDMFLVNFAGSILPGAAIDEERGRSRLYRNVDGKRFEDVTEKSGIRFCGFGMGAAWGDYDNDGDLDLFVTAYGDGGLYANQGDGTFRDVTDAAGVRDKKFGAGCAWADYDRDGDLDLYVCHYVRFVFRESDRAVVTAQYGSEQPYTLNPSSYPAEPNALFRNNGDGTFSEVALLAGVADLEGRSLSASWLDMDNDGWQDLYVANDISANGVFRNVGRGMMEDIGPSSLAADYRGAMGLAVSDFDNDLDLDFVVTHWIAQENALYRNKFCDPDATRRRSSRLWFVDAADEFGLGQISLDMVGWATGFCDFDNDGRRDLWLVNGSTIERSDDHRQLQAQRPLLFWNRGRDGFVEIGGRAAETLARPIVGRGGAQLDFDRDGRVDLVIVVHGAEPILLRNTSPSTGHWLRLDLGQRGGNTFAIGARAYVTAGGVTQMEELGSSSSYLSQSEHTLHFGLGEASRVERLRIEWPDGECEEHSDVAADQTLVLAHAADYSALVPGEGEPPGEPARQEPRPPEGHLGSQKHDK